MPREELPPRRTSWLKLDEDIYVAALRVEIVSQY